ncbi:Ganglioside GM2 activator, partial [Tinamus guttatus]
QVGGFSWENCGDGKDPVVLQSLSVAPDPITIPGNLRISAAVTGTKGLTSPLKVAAVPSAALGTKTPFGAILSAGGMQAVWGGRGFWPRPSLTPSPALPPQGSYSLPPSDFLLPDVELPSWMTNGNYRVRVAVSSKGEELACVKLAFSL